MTSAEQTSWSRTARPHVWICVAMSMLLGVLLAMAANRPPAVVAANASKEMFSAARAMNDVRVIAKAPHPIGSKEHLEVRAYLLDRLRDLELTIHARDGVETRIVASAFWPAMSVVVQNIVAELPGTDPALPAVLIMAHYDTVPRSPGAGDDTSGVATALEVARTLLVSAPHRRSVLFLFTDGEEPGLLGSNVFFSSDPLRERLGVVLNLEARGGSGRTAMFQTSLNNGGLIRLYGAAVDRPAASSLSAAIYRRMPNDTDLTPALASGLAGLNFAFIGSQVTYHSPLSTPETLDARSLQHMGDQVLAVTKAMVDADALPAASGDLVFSDVLGLILVRYPFWMGWVLAGVAALLLGFLLFRLRRQQRLSLRAVVEGAVGFVLLFIANALVLYLLSRMLRALANAKTTVSLLLWNFDLLFAGCGLIVVGVSALIVAGFARHALKHGRGAPLWGIWLGMLCVALLLAVLVQALLPAGGYLFVWPLLAALMTACVVAEWNADIDQPGALAAIAGAAALVLAQLGTQATAFFTAVGPIFPPVLSIFAPLAALALFPLLYRVGTERRAVLVSLVIAAVGVLLVAAAGSMPNGAPAVADERTEKIPSSPGGNFSAEIPAGQR